MSRKSLERCFKKIPTLFCEKRGHFLVGVWKFWRRLWKYQCWRKNCPNIFARAARIFLEGSGRRSKNYDANSFSLRRDVVDVYKPYGNFRVTSNLMSIWIQAVNSSSTWVELEWRRLTESKNHGSMRLKKEVCALCVSRDGRFVASGQLGSQSRKGSWFLTYGCFFFPANRIR